MLYKSYRNFIYIYIYIYTHTYISIPIFTLEASGHLGSWGHWEAWEACSRPLGLEETRENSKKLASEPPGGTGTSKRLLWEPLRPQNGGSGSHWGLGTTAPGATEASERPLREPVRPQNGRSGSHWDLGKASGSHWDLGKAAPGANERKNERTHHRTKQHSKTRSLQLASKRATSLQPAPCM